MLTAALALFLTSPFLMLRISENGGSFPKPLTAEEEQKYIELYMQGDMEARNVLIERNLRLVAHIIKKYYTQTSDQDDLISIGTIGLIKGITTYKPDRKVRLATYASRCIENAMFIRVTHITPFGTVRKRRVGVRAFEKNMDYIISDYHTFQNAPEQLEFSVVVH